MTSRIYSGIRFAWR